MIYKFSLYIDKHSFQLNKDNKNIFGSEHINDVISYLKKKISLWPFSIILLTCVFTKELSYTGIVTSNDYQIEECIKRTISIVPENLLHSSTSTVDGRSWVAIDTSYISSLFNLSWLTVSSITSVVSPTPFITTPFWKIKLFFNFKKTLFIFLFFLLFLFPFNVYRFYSHTISPSQTSSFTILEHSFYSSFLSIIKNTPPSIVISSTIYTQNVFTIHGYGKDVLSIQNYFLTLQSECSVIESSIDQQKCSFTVKVGLL
ncbi:hypothetical protein ACFL56_01650 [Candidatus Margulisiibacteriota bacterium]